MPTPTKGKRLGGSPAHERLMLGNLATALFEHGSITTTENRARRLRPFAERLITKAKRGDLHARRQVLKVIRDKSVVHTLFTEIGPRFETRPGGYTRITKIGPRKGDNAPMAVIELVEEEMPAATTSGSTSGGTSGSTSGSTSGATSAPSSAAAASPATETAEADATEAETPEAESPEAGSPEAESPEAESPEAESPESADDTKQ